MSTITVKDGMTIWARLLHLRRARRRPLGPQCFMTGMAMALGKEAMDDRRI